MYGKFHGNRCGTLLRVAHTITQYMEKNCNTSPKWGPVILFIFLQSV